MFGFEIFAYLCYIFAWSECVPSIVRMVKRKSSEDYSLWTNLIDLASLISWFIYVIKVDTSLELIVCWIIDFIIYILYTYFIIKYHKRED